MPESTVAHEIMRSNLVTVTPDMSVMEAVRILLHHKFSGAPVLDDEGTLVGILSEFDCVNHLSAAAMNRVPPKRVGDVMTKGVETVSPDTTLLTLVHRFAQKRFRRLPVVDESGHLLGQISRRDLMKALYDKLQTAHGRSDGPLYLSAVTNQTPAKITGERKK